MARLVVCLTALTIAEGALALMPIYQQWRVRLYRRIPQTCDVAGHG